MGWKYDGMCLYIPDMNDPLALPAAQEYVQAWNEQKVFPRGAHVLELRPGTDPGSHKADDLRPWIEGNIKYLDNNWSPE